MVVGVEKIRVPVARLDWVDGQTKNDVATDIFIQGREKPLLTDIFSQGSEKHAAHQPFC